MSTYFISILFFILSLANVSLAQEKEKSLEDITNIPNIDIVVHFSNKPKAPTVNQNYFNLENIRFQNMNEKPEDFAKRLKEKLEQAEGGDDVGNGGDNLRQYFLKVAQGILQQIPDQSLVSEIKPVLDINRIIAVKNLQSEISGELVSFKALASEGYIFLDSDAWDEDNGLLSGQLDPRFEILRLIYQAAQINISEEDIIIQYSNFEIFRSPVDDQPEHVAPWCSVIIDTSIIEKTAVTFKEVHDSDENTARIRALNSCNHLGLFECRVKETVLKGFLSNQKYHVTVQGMRYNYHEMNSSQIRQATCNKLQRCEVLHELAPVGQISPGGSFELMQKIEGACN